MNMNFNEYIESIRNKSVAIIGIGVSNTPLLYKLLNSGIKVKAYDKRTAEQLGSQYDELLNIGCTFSLGENYLCGLNEDIIFRTPGLRPDVKEIEEAVAKGSILTSEMEVFFDVCPCPIIAVTGSDGKTTTTTIISELLKEAGYTVHVGGNIGNPLLCDSMSMCEKDFAVLELSSFQLLTMKKSPMIAVITNLAPNHLDVHKGMEEYVDAKKNIMRYQTESNICVLNEDNEITKSLYGFAKGVVRNFSRQKPIEKGVYLANETIIYTDGISNIEIMDTADIRIPGNHNVENYMAAIAAVIDYVKPEIIKEFAKKFGGVEHRIEFVREYHGTKFYNDSIASSPSRTIAGLNSFKEKVILIAGGYDKHIPFDVLGPEVCKHVKILVLCGATADKIEAAVLAAPEYKENEPVIVRDPNFKSAVEKARDMAQEGDIVTLSPACAAFDQFKNFMVRGRTYKEIVNSWNE